MKVKVSCSVMSHSLWPHGLYSPWNSGLEWVAASLGDLPNPGIEPRSPILQVVFYQLSHEGSPRILEWVIYSFSQQKWNKVWSIEPSVQFSSVAQLCPTLCDPMNHSTPGLPVHHHLPKFTQLTSIQLVMPSSLGSSSFSILSFCLFICSRGSQGKNTEVVCHSLLQWTTFCQTSPPWPARLGWPHGHGLVSLS